MSLRLNHSQRVLLTECLRRTQQLAAVDPPPEWERYAYAAWRDEKELGPRYSCRDWFGKVSAAERMRFFRALRAIEDAGLVEASRVDALRTRQAVYLRLTPSGEKLAHELLSREPIEH